MARGIHRLTAKQVTHAKATGLHADGGGLYLKVAPGGSKSWVFRFTLNGKPYVMGLGGELALKLADAREKAAEARRMVKVDGVNPLEIRREKRNAARAAVAKTMTFRQCAEAYIAAHQDSWKNPKHAAQWPSTLEAYAYPVFGHLPVKAVDVGLVTKVIEPIWKTKTETASRLRGRIEAVLDWAKVRGYRDGENPARWRGHLDNLLPARGKVAKVAHHAALPFDQIAGFMSNLRSQDAVAAKALEFTILNAARTSEVIGATWAEIDLAAKTWTVPGERMKAGREHRVPLSDAAIAVLLDAMPLAQSPQRASIDDVPIFPGRNAGSFLSNMSMTAVLRRMGTGDITVHGFRSAFRDWASEATDFQGEVAEAALAHVVGDKVEAAYRRGDLFEKRRRLMDAWAAYCASAPNPANDAAASDVPTVSPVAAVG